MTTKNSLETVVIDANTAVLDENIRTNTALDDAFIESVREHGVQTPTIGYRDEAGAIHILAGQRRTLAARETGQQLPVVLTEATTDTRARIVSQIIENEQRASLTQRERINAWKQLELDGMTVPAIAKTLGQPKKSVKAGLTVATSKKPVDDESANKIDLLHLATLVEFEENEGEYAELLHCAIEYPESFEHRLEEARRAIADEALVQARIAELREGFAVTIDREEIARVSEYTKIDRESRLEKNENLPVTATNDSLDVRILVESRRMYGAKEAVIEETRYIYDYPAYGYQLKSYLTPGGASNSGPMTDEQKAERKLLIERNKSWDAAAPVRGRWLAEFLQSRKFPTDCGEFTAVAFMRFGTDLANRGQEMSVTLLGLEYKYPGYSQSQLANLVTERPARAGALTLALVLGQFEAGMNRESWRYPTEGGKFFFQQIEKWGYTLSDVERLAAGYLADDESVNAA